MDQHPNKFVRSRHLFLSLVALVYILLTATIVIPVLMNPTLRSNYFLLLSKWRARVIRPSFALIGDSMTTRGGVWGWRLSYDPLSAIDLSQSGLVTWQIVETAKTAIQYRPLKILVMAGTNDAEHPADVTQLASEWEKLFAITGPTPVIVTLPPKTTDGEINARLSQIEPIITKSARSHSATVIDLNDDIARDGTIQPRFTVDGEHLSEAAYAIWVAKLLAAVGQ